MTNEQEEQGWISLTNWVHHHHQHYHCRRRRRRRHHHLLVVASRDCFIMVTHCNVGTSSKRLLDMYSDVDLTNEVWLSTQCQIMTGMCSMPRQAPRVSEADAKAETRDFCPGGPGQSARISSVNNDSTHIGLVYCVHWLCFVDDLTNERDADRDTYWRTPTSASRLAVRRTCLVHRAAHRHWVKRHLPGQLSVNRTDAVAAPLPRHHQQQQQQQPVLLSSGLGLGLAEPRDHFWAVLVLFAVIISSLFQSRDAMIHYCLARKVMSNYRLSLRCWRLGLRPDLQNILRQSYDYLTIMPKLRSTYDGRLIYETSYEGRKAFLRYDSLAKL